ncbi:MAG: hydroxymethylglutaryl-CoA lyase, partial [Sphingobacteriales bacterium]
MEATLQLVECPRDAMQGWKSFIPTTDKIRYLNLLLKAGFHTLDFGSFVSPKYIPQMADTAFVLEKLDPSPTQLLAIVANLRGAQDATKHQRIKYLGFPFSVSETFQQRNTHSSREEALHTVEEIEKLCRQTGKELVVYMSMGFGNPYG